MLTITIHLVFGKRLACYLAVKISLESNEDIKSKTTLYLLTTSSDRITLKLKAKIKSHSLRTAKCQVDPPLLVSLVAQITAAGAARVHLTLIKDRMNLDKFNRAWNRIGHRICDRKIHFPNGQLDIYVWEKRCGS